MSILARLYPSAGLHRFVASRAELRAENARLERENSDLACQLVAATTALARTELDLDAAAVRWSGIALARDAAQETAQLVVDEMHGMEAELRQLRADAANTTAVTVAAWVRPIDDGDTATQPIPTGQHWAEPARSHVVHLRERGAA